MPAEDESPTERRPHTFETKEAGPREQPFRLLTGSTVVLNTREPKREFYTVDLGPKAKPAAVPRIGDPRPANDVAPTTADSSVFEPLRLGLEAQRRDSYVIAGLSGLVVLTGCVAVFKGATGGTELAIGEIKLNSVSVGVTLIFLGLGFAGYMIRDARSRTHELLKSALGRARSKGH